MNISLTVDTFWYIDTCWYIHTVDTVDTKWYILELQITKIYQAISWGIRNTLLNKNRHPQQNQGKEQARVSCLFFVHFEQALLGLLGYTASYTLMLRWTEAI